MNETVGIACCWEWVGREESKEAWVLLEIFPFDDNGHSDRGDRYPWGAWAYKQLNPGAPDNYADPEPIPGRVVTIWTWEYGARLEHFCKPSEVPWLSHTFAALLKDDADWWMYLEEGHFLLEQTAVQAKRLLTPRRKKK